MPDASSRRVYCDPPYNGREEISRIGGKTDDDKFSPANCGDSSPVEVDPIGTADPNHYIKVMLDGIFGQDELSE